MRDKSCIALLEWAMPRLQLRWPGFRRVHGQVCKRLRRRVAELGLSGLAAYRERLEHDESEWRRLDVCCVVTVSRFFRDEVVFGCVGETVLPEIAARAARERRAALAWSAGCASGEEAYTLRILWDLVAAPRSPGVPLTILATDVDDVVLGRAREGCYAAASLRELPAELRERAFAVVGGRYCLRPAFRHGITFLRQDLRETMPEGPFDLVLCRNLAFTYFTPALQRTVLGRMTDRLAPDGWLVIGAQERLPPDVDLDPLPGLTAIFRRVATDDAPVPASLCP